jgi:hypothetical protein
MKENILLYVEGEADVKFLSDCVLQWFCVELNKSNFINLKGIENLWKNDQTIKANSSKIGGGVNLVILDTDYEGTNGGIKQRTQELTDFRSRNELDFDFFLFPNNSSDGDLEVLLESIINPKHQVIFDCWKSYEECLNEKGSYTIPARKTKIYGYVEALVGSTNSEKEKIKERNRNYRNPEHWDLNSEKLNPLREFLTKYFK